MTTDAFVGSVRSADGTIIAFERAGSGPILVMVDAAGGYRGLGPLGPLSELLATHFTVYRYDRRGRGESTDTLPYALEREIEDLSVIIDEAGGSAYVYALSSGALLAMHAAASGLAIPKLVLFEPPIGGDDDTPTGESAFTAELVAAGRRGDAVERFHTSIGVPDEFVSGMRHAPFWPLMEAVAHTLVYDCIVSDATSLASVASVTAPTLVIDSEGSTGDLTGWAAAVVGALPNGSHRSLVGEWHSVPDEDLAPVIAEFLLRG